MLMELARQRNDRSPPTPADYQRRLEGLVYGRQRTNVGSGGSGKVRPEADLRVRKERAFCWANIILKPSPHAQRGL